MYHRGKENEVYLGSYVWVFVSEESEGFFLYGSCL